jgi:hypothetical protein
MCPLLSGGLDSENKTHFINSISQQCFRCTGYINVRGYSEGIHDHNFEEANFLVYISKEFERNTTLIILTEGTGVVRRDRQTDRRKPHASEAFFAILRYLVILSKNFQYNI